MNAAQINLFDEIIVDNFAGGGGASTGIELALGRPVTIAINHDPAAILMHKTNHPHTLHLQASVWDVDPVEVCGGPTVNTGTARMMGTHIVVTLTHGCAPDGGSAQRAGAAGRRREEVHNAPD